MRDWNRKTYLKEVVRLGRHPDLFERYCLDYDDDDRDAIQARLDEVRAYWNNTATKQAGDAKIVIEQLLREHPASAAELLDPAARRAAAARARDAAAVAAAKQYAPVDEALEELHRAHGGIPADRLERLVRIGAHMGLGEETVLDHVRRTMAERGWREIAPVAVVAADALSPNDAARIRQRLARLENERGQTGDDRHVRTLFDALELPFDAEPGEAAAALEALAAYARNEVRQSSALKTAIGDIVAEARQHLTDEASASRYRATVVAEVCAELRPRFMRFVAADDLLSADEHDALLREAMKLGLPQAVAAQAIDVLVESSDQPVRVEVSTAVVALITCVQCHSPAPEDGSQPRCRSCGEELFRRCPNCAERSPRAEPFCRHCAFSFIELERAARSVHAGYAALERRRPAVAGEHAEAALRLDPQNSDGLALQRQVSAVLVEVRQRWAAVEAAVSARRLYQARALLDSLSATAADVPGPNGELAEAAAERIADELAGAEARLTQARAARDPAEHERLLAQVLAHVSDSAEARRALEQLPPRPPAELTATLQADAVRLAWMPSPSPGVEEYVVVRGIDVAPRGIGDGVVAARGAASTALDDTAPVGRRAGYAVVAMRAGTASEPATLPPMLVAVEASEVRASVASGEVRLSWRLPTAEATVVVERTTSDGSPPQALDAGPDGLVDTGLENGVMYAYCVRVQYAGAPAPTPGVTVHATPAEPPRPVALATMLPVADGVEVRWSDPPSGRVVVCRSMAALDLEPGLELQPSSLGDLGDLLPGEGGRAVDRAPADGAFYTPFTIAGDRAVSGTGLVWEDMPAITDVRAEDRGGVARITWAWPEGIHHAMVLWRSDGSDPVGPDDPAAERRHVRRDQHQQVNGGGFRIDLSGRRSLRVAVHPARMRDGELRVGPRLAPSSRARVAAAGSHGTVRYVVRVKRGLRGRSLQIRLEGSAPMPEVVLVAKPGDIVPLRAADGQPIAQLGGDGRPTEVDVPVGSLPPARPLALRAFLTADSAASRWHLQEPDDLTSLVLR